MASTQFSSDMLTPTIIANSAGWMMGGLTFPTILRISQSYVFYPLGFDTSTRFKASSCGFLAVLIGGSVSSLLAIELRNRVILELDSDTSVLPSYSFKNRKSTDKLLLCGMLSTVMFRLFGGRFINIIPSNVATRGAYANIMQSLPASSSKYATANERKLITKLGQAYGCHTCGAKSGSTIFHADHQPPNAHKWFWQTQRFYAQCQNCSGKQGASIGSKTVRSITHFNFRMYLVWMPIPLFLEAASEYDA
ncbi:hypothetical protein SARC_05488 [Sphaeroforma arctica JP610]|uniref:Uncharacterized protein n=1 Tax=Sphaeroforma arctica JP610 TaxID=667725 RepID=A0A0L0G061_9EUKA|nr:hypothetical protein SARC_05488 [Sphaeroforma arctica JP610]KNC82221.1 hypothetical protein SARC_05488 [Sphaeroforma arctica JP610]|eukprot:XP_014156123.1 hypothetical protein SARC_05488 [Sphaeroforma arctica JP610]